MKLSSSFLSVQEKKRGSKTGVKPCASSLESNVTEQVVGPGILQLKRNLNHWPLVCPILLQTYLEYLCAKKKPGRREDENEDDGKRSTQTSTASEE
uniref:Uncharacterized protein n=1 Tax=Vespula pensylvanica TaxID=30213 RepID=A0A834KML4_VESPE|nr:hypothetical protein H0235_013316 [Vespula pensylvanica]